MVDESAAGAQAHSHRRATRPELSAILSRYVDAVRHLRPLMSVFCSVCYSNPVSFWHDEDEAEGALAASMSTARPYLMGSSSPSK